MTKQDLINLEFDLYAINRKESYEHFTSKPNKILANMFGAKVEDFVSVQLKVIDFIDWSKGAKDYTDKFYGYYDIEREELSGSFIFDNFLQTSVCFTYNPRIYEEKGKGIFVQLELKENDLPKSAKR